MARRANAEAIYHVADLFRQRCLVEKRSLLWPEYYVWTTENLAAPWKAFVEHPDTSKRSFLEKWRDQLTDQPLDIHRIAADLMAIYNLFPSKTTSKTKESRVMEIVNWKLKGEQPDYTLLTDAYTTGIGYPGAWYSMGMPFHMAFYVEFCRKIVAGEADPSDPVGCKRVAEEALQKVSGDASAARHILLHLLFPNEFERIASTNHKNRIFEAFKELAEDSEDIDDALAKIRRGLVERYKREELDFYQDDIEAIWAKPRPPDSERRYWVEKTLVAGRALTVNRVSTH